MSKQDVNMIMDTLNLNSTTNKKNSIAMYQRYLEIKGNYGDEYEAVVIPYRRLIRRQIEADQSNPLFAAVEFIEVLRLDTDADQIIADLILCAAIDVGINISLTQLSVKGYNRMKQLH